MTKINSTLFIRSLELNVNLGWRRKERQQEQAVLLDIDICFPKPPKACKTDKLEDTICYAILAKDIQDKISAKNFHLIEHLSYEIYTIVKMKLPKKSKVTVRITKYPKIKGLIDGVCFSYADE